MATTTAPWCKTWKKEEWNALCLICPHAKSELMFSKSKKYDGKEMLLAKHNTLDAIYTAYAPVIRLINASHELAYRHYIVLEKKHKVQEHKWKHRIARILIDYRLQLTLDGQRINSMNYFSKDRKSLMANLTNSGGISFVTTLRWNSTKMGWQQPGSIYVVDKAAVQHILSFIRDSFVMFLMPSCRPMNSNPTALERFLCRPTMDKHVLMLIYSFLI